MTAGGAQLAYLRFAATCRPNNFEKTGPTNSMNSGINGAMRFAYCALRAVKDMRQKLAPADNKVFRWEATRMPLGVLTGGER
jgi:hypothetical protein